jgi:hypothetical protein
MSRFQTADEYREVFDGASDELVNRDAEIPTGDFYVTVRNGQQSGFLLGPYTDYRDALTNVKRGRDLACNAVRDAHWYAYGTCRLPVGTTCKTVFGR